MKRPADCFGNSYFAKNDEELSVSLSISIPRYLVDMIDKEIKSINDKNIGGKKVEMANRSRVIRSILDKKYGINKGILNVHVRNPQSARPDLI